MKKISLSLLLLCCSFFAFSQVVPSFQLGIKGGVNLAKFNTKDIFSSSNQAGYYAGLWARIGAAGIHLQPELYLTGKNSNIKKCFRCRKQSKVYKFRCASINWY